MIVSFQVHCGGGQSQNNENCVNVPIYMDLTVYACILTSTAVGGDSEFAAGPESTEPGKLVCVVEVKCLI